MGSQSQIILIVSQLSLTVNMLVAVLLLSLALTVAPSPAPLQNWYSTPFSWIYQNDIFTKAASKNKLSEKMVTGRYLLKHNKYDGLEEVLGAYDLDKEVVAAIRDAKILTEISLGDSGSVSVATSDAESSDPPNVVTFSPTVSTNITNPLNGEQVEFVGTVLTSTMLQTKSRGLDTNILEIKTWQFTPYGASVVTEIVKEKEQLTILAKQFMERVDENNEKKPLVLQWV